MTFLYFFDILLLRIILHLLIGIIDLKLFVSIENYTKTEFSRYIRIVDIESPSTLLPLDVVLKNME
jgi:hypothetical protein